MNKPEHIAIILDGNRRWARAKGLPDNEGHKLGLENINNLIDWCIDDDIKILSLYCLSVENLKRSKSELDFLFEYIKTNLEDYIKQIADNKKKGIKIEVIGDFKNVPTATLFDAVDNVGDIINEKKGCLTPEVLEATKRLKKMRENQQNGLPDEILNSINKINDLTDKEWKNDKPKLLVNLCICYGGRQDIAQAARAVAEKGLEINEENINANLFTKGAHDVDLLIRTGGEQRLSNFLLWQASYAELYFTDKMWPEFANEDFTAALDWFGNRQRRFGR